MSLKVRSLAENQITTCEDGDTEKEIRCGMLPVFLETIEAAHDGCTALADLGSRCDRNRAKEIER